MTDSDIERASGFANAALALLARAKIPPYPIFFELFYTYATGTDSQLNARINELLGDGGTLSQQQATVLCEEFLNISDADSRIRSMSRAMSEKILDVHHAIDQAMASAHSYSGSLEKATGDLDRGVDREALKAMSSRLLSETKRMQDINRQLEDQLESSRDDISVLQRDLDEVRRQSMLDPLTKIPNRQCFDEHLEIEIAQAGEQEVSLCLLVLDIDLFKHFNDTYGHLTGDQVLRLVAQVLKANLKGRDMAARFGGEEFVAILPDTELSGAVAVADTIRKSVQGKELFKRSTNEKLGRITLSVGVAQWRPGEASSALIERADRCLYAAKSAGRNKVVSERGMSGAGSKTEVA